MAMRGRVIVIAILAVAAIGISLWQPWRDAGPAPDVSAEAGAAGEPAAAALPAAPPRQEPPPDAGAARAPARVVAHRTSGRSRRGRRAAGCPDDENRARLRAMHEAMVAATPEVARLYGAFVRSRVPAPPEAKTLIEMKQRGVPQDVLVQFVNSTFHDLPARAIALRWLGVGAGRSVRPPSAGQPPSDPATGTLVRRDAG